MASDGLGDGDGLLPTCELQILFFFCVPGAEGVIECIRENPGKLKVHLCTAQVHPEIEQTKGPGIMLA